MGLSVTIWTMSILQSVTSRADAARRVRLNLAATCPGVFDFVLLPAVSSLVPAILPSLLSLLILLSLL